MVRFTCAFGYAIRKYTEAAALTSIDSPIKKPLSIIIVAYCDIRVRNKKRDIVTKKLNVFGEIRARIRIKCFEIDR